MIHENKKNKKNKKISWLARVTWIATFFAFLVIGLGAYTRITNSGLGCPDWPGCYGRVTVQTSALPVTGSYIKAWTEMVHRYCAGVLAILTIVVALVAVSSAVNCGISYLAYGILLLFLVCYQAILGMWTVTMKLLPIVVSQHLLGGLAIFSILWILHLKSLYSSDGYIYRKIRTRDFSIMLLALIFVIMQIILGAWNSTNYAGLSCESFPFCSRDNNFPWHLREAFDITLFPKMNYEGGILPLVARQTINMLHRVFALLTVCYVLFFVVYMKHYSHIYKITKQLLILMIFVMLQFLLGVANVVWHLPLIIALFHNLCATIILATILAIMMKCTYARCNQKFFSRIYAYE